MLTYVFPWYPERISGDRVTYRNQDTGERRTAYTSDPTQAKKDIDLWRVLLQGLPYPWRPIKVEGNYLYYHNDQSGEDTKVYIPTSMLESISQATNKGVLSNKKNLKVPTGNVRAGWKWDATQNKWVGAIFPEEGTKLKSQTIERGDFRLLQEMMTARERAESPYATHPFTKRIGTVTQVIDGSTIIVDGVIVRIKNAETPNYKQDPDGWNQAKRATEALALGQQVTLRINLDNPEDTNGNVLALVYLQGNTDVSGILQQKGLAPVTGTEDPTFWQNAYQWGIQWNFFDKILTPFYAVGAIEHNLAVQQSFGHWGSAGIMDKYSISDTLSLRRTINYLTTGEGAILPKLATEDERIQSDFWDKFATDLLLDPSTHIPKGSITRIGRALGASEVEKSITNLLNRVEAPEIAYETIGMRMKRGMRQVMTLYNPTYLPKNVIGDTWNVYLSGVRNPARIVDAVRSLEKPQSLALGEKIILKTPTKAYTQNELRALATKYDYLSGSFSETNPIFGRDWFDRAWTTRKLQGINNYQTSRMRQIIFVDRLMKGDSPAQADAYVLQHMPGNYRLLTNFERKYLAPDIPFYSWRRQDIWLQAGQYIEQPYTYTTLAHFVKAFGATDEERKRMREYQQGYINIRMPTDPTKFYHIPLPVEDISTLYNQISSPEKLMLMAYPWVSAIPELITDKNFFDETKPSSDYPKYLAKKFAAGNYYRFTDVMTNPDKEEMLVQRMSGFGIEELPPATTDLGQSLVDVRYALGYDQLRAQNAVQKFQNTINDRLATSRHMANQTALPPALRDRPLDRWNTLDKVLFPFTIESYNWGAFFRNLAIYRQTGKWGSYTWEDKLTISDTITYVKATKNLLGITQTHNQRFEDKGSGWVWHEYTGDNAPKSEWWNPLGEWEGGFWDRFGTDMTQFSTLITNGGTTITYAGRKIILSPAGETLAKQLFAKYGEKETPHILARMLRNPEVAKEAIHQGGLKFAGYAIPYTKWLTKPVGWAFTTATKPIKEYGGAGLTWMDRTFSDVLKIIRPTVVHNKPIEYSEIRTLLRDMRNRIRLNQQQETAEVHVLKIEAGRTMGRGYGRVITALIDEPEKRSWYPNLKPIIGRIESLNQEMATEEKFVEILEKTRENYLYRVLTPEAEKAMTGKTLKLPKGYRSPYEQRQIWILFGYELNPFNRQRVYQETVAELNDWSMKNNGFPLFVEDAFTAMDARIEKHVTSMELLSTLDDMVARYGRDTPARGFKRSKIARIDKGSKPYLPEEFVDYMEKQDPLFRKEFPEITKPSLALKTGKGGLWVYDGITNTWRVAVTFMDIPTWFSQNVQSGVLYNIVFGKVGMTKYPVAQLERYRLWKGLYKDSDVVFEGIWGHKYTASEVRELLGDPETSELVFGQAGYAGESIKDMPNFAGEGLTGLFKRALFGLGQQTETFNRYPLWRETLIRTQDPEKAKAMVAAIQLKYNKKDMGWFQREIVSRFIQFPVWQFQNPLVVTQGVIDNPRFFVALPQVMNAWNGDQGKVEKGYLPDYLLTRFLFRAPYQDGAFMAPAILSGIASVTSLPYLFSETQFNFYWDEAKKDPYLVKKLAKEQLEVDWLRNRGGGVAEVRGNDIVITYRETGESVTASLNSSRNKLVFTDDQTGLVLKELPTINVNGKVGINTDMRPLERIAARFILPQLLWGVEMWTGRNFMSGSPIEDNWKLVVNSFLSQQQREYKELGNPAVESWEAQQDFLFANSIYWVNNYYHVPIDPPLKEKIDHLIWQLDGDALGCGW